MALQIDVSEVAAALDSVEMAIRAHHDRLSIDDMLELCTNAAAGSTGWPAVSLKWARHAAIAFAGITGGLLLENFVATSGHRASRRAILALAKTCREAKRECTMDECKKVIEKERVGFVCSILASLANRGRAANRQLFFFSLLAQARGLSRTGMEFFSSLKVCLPPRTFDLELATFLCSVNESQRSVIAAGCGDTCVDACVQRRAGRSARRLAGQLLQILRYRSARTGRCGS